MRPIYPHPDGILPQVLTQEELAGLVPDGAVRFFLISGQGNRQNGFLAG
ncbi:MAG TPA: hypothetical protein G4N99_10735 [Thermoflexia bacterium]|nr:hypothetical protein [Thermoflexia bacterium]